MGADRAKLTFTPTRQYREVVAQQGRVTLEADLNEASRIAAEALRLETIDIVGPAGTPDNGYDVDAVSAGATLAVGKGTMYLAGQRLTLPSPILIEKQPDWLDQAQDPLWTDPDKIEGHAVLGLLAQEQEIGAVEDPALRETALGGPDTSARIRLLQRFPLIPAKAATCAAAIKEVGAFWAARGRDLDTASATLRSRSRLLVSALSTAPAASPCDPPAQSGYLGADNQLIRVQITEFNPATRTGRLLWGFNNASTLYRCKPLDATTLELAARPVAPEFTPASKQAVQLLFAAADLGEGALAAALTGHVATLATAYQPDTQTVVLPAAMPAAYQKPPAGRPLFLRLWQEDLPFALDTAVKLGETGLAVTIGSSSGSALGIGDYWSFAVRPLTPELVYPARLLATPQPPDGPRLSFCDLAVVNRVARRFSVSDDCRLKFDSLVELTARRSTATGCCISLKPAQAKQLQIILDRLAATGSDHTVHLEPGVYDLPAPLRLDARHRGLVLARCGGGRVVLRAPKVATAAFARGMILLDRAADITLQGLEFHIPVVIEDDTPPPPPPVPATSVPGGFNVFTDQSFVAAPRLIGGRRIDATGKSIGGPTAIGVHIAGNADGGDAVLPFAARIVIEDCSFLFPPTPGLFGAGIFGRDALPELRVRNCRFTPAARLPEALPLVAGILIVPANEPEAGALIPPLLTTGAFTGNEIAGLGFGLLLAGQLGDITISGNEVGGAFCGVAVLSLPPRLGAWSNLFEVPPGESEKDPGFQTVEAMNLAFIRGPQLTALLDQAFDVPDIDRTPRGAGRAPLGATRLEISANRLSTTPRFGGSNGRVAAYVSDSAAPALYLWNAAREPAMLATVSANTCTGASGRAAVAMLLMPDQMTVTGNLFSNGQLGSTDQQERLALVVVPGGRVNSRGQKAMVNLFAVTGNTMLGRSNLHLWPREEWRQELDPLKVPLLTWDFLNTEA